MSARRARPVWGLGAGEDVESDCEYEGGQKNVCAPERMEQGLVEHIFVPGEIGVVDAGDKKDEDCGVDEHFENSADFEENGFLLVRVKGLSLWGE